MTNNKKNIRNLTEGKLEEFFLSNKMQKFRASQVKDWLWNKTINSFDEMTNLPLATREILNNNFTILILEIH